LLLDGTVHVTKLFFRPTNNQPPPSVNMSHQTWPELEK
jgi:hypothetical protein